MYLTSILTATLSVFSLATALPQATTTNTSPPPPGETYITGYPLCGVPGYTQTPGPYVETIYQESNSTLSSCAAACRKAYPSCQSFAFQANYTECLFYTACVQETQLWNDGSSLFVHYDLSCNV